MLASIDVVQTSPPPEQMAIEYVWYDTDEHGNLEVLENEEYHADFANLAFQTKRA